MDNIKIVYDIWHSHDNYLGKIPQQSINYDLAQYIADLFCPGKYYYYVINSPTLTFDTVSNSVEDLLGIKPENFTLAKLIDLIHPDDIHFMMKCEDVVAYFLKNCIATEDITKYKISYCLREKTKQGDYRLFLLQTITIKTTEEGALLKVFGSHTDITHITNINNHKLSFIGLGNCPSFLEIDVFNDKVLTEYKPFDLKNIYPFTKREIEILRHLSLGKDTKKIAQELYVSINTVETHRGNILSKTNAKNMVELVADCVRKGII